jgi:hypothetical protein
MFVGTRRLTAKGNDDDEEEEEEEEEKEEEEEEEEEEVFIEDPNIECNENPVGGNRADTYGQTDGSDATSKPICGHTKAPEGDKFLLTTFRR